jgi:hypothetical protein
MIYFLKFFLLCSPFTFRLFVQEVPYGTHRYCSALLRAEFFIEPPPDTQRKERQGERGIWFPQVPYSGPGLCRTVTISVLS